MVIDSVDCLRINLNVDDGVSGDDLECFYCKGTAAANHALTLSTFNLPITSDGLMTGVTMV